MTEETSKLEKAGEEEESIGMVSRIRNAVPPPKLWVVSAEVKEEGKLRRVKPGGVTLARKEGGESGLTQVSEKEKRSGLYESMRSETEWIRLGCRRDRMLREIKEKAEGPGLGLMSPARRRAIETQGCRRCMRRGLGSEKLRKAAVGRVLR